MCNLLTGEAVVTPEEHSQPCSFHPTSSLRAWGCFQVTRPEPPLRCSWRNILWEGETGNAVVVTEPAKHPLPFYLLIFIYIYIYLLIYFLNLCFNSLCHRYYFKKASDEFDCGAVFEEVWEDETVLPMYEGRILGKVERID